jgi:hypothetical protein
MQLYLLALLTIILLIVIAILYFMYRKVNHLSILVNQLLNDMVSLQNLTDSQMRQSLLFPSNLFHNTTIMPTNEHICLTNDNHEVDQDDQEDQEDQENTENSSNNSSDSDESEESEESDESDESDEIRNEETNDEITVNNNQRDINSERINEEKIMTQVYEIMENEIKKKNIESIINTVTEHKPEPINVSTLTTEKIITMNNSENNTANDEEKREKRGRKKKEYIMDGSDLVVREDITGAKKVENAEQVENIVVGDQVVIDHEEVKKPVEKKKYIKKKANINQTVEEMIQESTNSNNGNSNKEEITINL